MAVRLPPHCLAAAWRGSLQRIGLLAVPFAVCDLFTPQPVAGAMAARLSFAAQTCVRGLLHGSWLLISGRKGL